MIDIFSYFIAGICATACMDLHVYLHSKIFHTIPTNCYFTARWVGTVIKREKIIGNITQMPKWKYETTLGWLGHYVMGTVMVSAFLMMVGQAWIDAPRVLPVIIYLNTLILFPFCVLQPSFGFGFFGSKTRDPKAARKRVFIAYVGFGIGVYLSGWLLHYLK